MATLSRIVARLLRVDQTRELTPTERRLVLRSMALVAVPLATITVAAMTAGFLVYRADAQAQINRNRAAIVAANTASAEAKRLARRLDAERRTREATIARAVFSECVQNEAQDAIFASFVQGLIDILRRQPSSPARDRLIESWREARLAAEPPGEADCKLPGANVPDPQMPRRG